MTPSPSLKHLNNTWILPHLPSRQSLSPILWSLKYLVYLCSLLLLIIITKMYWTKHGVLFRIWFLVLITTLKKYVLWSAFYIQGNWNCKEIKQLAPKVICLSLTDLGFELSSIWFSCQCLFYCMIPSFLLCPYVV